MRRIVYPSSHLEQRRCETPTRFERLSLLFYRHASVAFATAAQSTSGGTLSLRRASLRFDAHAPSPCDSVIALASFRSLGALIK
jgi:hypothetical protein